MQLHHIIAKILGRIVVVDNTLCNQLCFGRHYSTKSSGMDFKIHTYPSHAYNNYYTTILHLAPAHVYILLYTMYMYIDAYHYT